MNPKIRLKAEEQVELRLVQLSSITCHKCGSNNYEEKGLTKAGTQRYYCNICKAKFVQFPVNKVLIKGDDVWFAEDMGLRIHPHRRGHGTKLNFQTIKQEWFKEVIKKFIKYKASTQTSFQMIIQFLTSFNDFSFFLTLNPCINKIEDIDRDIIISYLHYNNERKLAPKNKCGRISSLTSFFETGSANSWFIVESYLIRKEDYPKKIKSYLVTFQMK